MVFVLLAVALRAFETAEMSAAAESLDIFGKLSKAITKVKIDSNGKGHKKCNNVKMNIYTQTISAT